MFYRNYFVYLQKTNMETINTDVFQAIIDFENIKNYIHLMKLIII